MRWLLFLTFALTGCTAESTRIALDAQRRADEVQQTIVDQQHQALRVLLFRDLVAKLGAAGVDWNDQRLALVSDIWNDRDLIEFWVLQQERARALRLVGVDIKLWADQSIVDLLIKQLKTKAARVPLAAIMEALNAGMAERKEDSNRQSTPEPAGRVLEFGHID